MPLWRTPALRQLPSQAARHSRPATRARMPQIQLLLRSRRLQEASDTAVGALPRAKGLPRRDRHPDQRHAARTLTTPRPRAFHTLRCRRKHNHPLADLLARTLPTNTLLEGRTRRFPHPWRDRLPALLAGRCLSPPSSPCRGWTLLLRFLSPITVPGGLQIKVSP